MKVPKDDSKVLTDIRILEIKQFSIEVATIWSRYYMVA